MNDRGLNCKVNNMKILLCYNDKNMDDIEKLTGKLNICYARVSSLNQRDDLERQKHFLMEKYPDYTLIEEYWFRNKF